MSQLARIIYNTTTKVVLTVVAEDPTTTTILTLTTSEGEERGGTIGNCSSIYVILVAQGYDVTVLESYMNDNNLTIPSE